MSRWKLPATHALLTRRILLEIGLHQIGWFSYYTVFYRFSLLTFYHYVSANLGFIICLVYFSWLLGVCDVHLSRFYIHSFFLMKNSTLTKENSHNFFHLRCEIYTSYFAGVVWNTLLNRSNLGTWVLSIYFAFNDAKITESFSLCSLVIFSDNSLTWM